MIKNPIPTIRRSGPRPFPPRVSSFTRPFWTALEEGSLTAPKCQGCGRLRFPPRPLCPACWSEDHAWIVLQPHGRLYSFTRIHVAPRAMDSDVPYAIGIVDLDDGVRLLCRLVDPVVFGDIGRKVEIVVLRYDDGPLFGARLT